VDLMTEKGFTTGIDRAKLDAAAAFARSLRSKGPT
jgi:hypothetical protein